MNWTKINPSLAGSALALVVLTAGLTWSLRAPVHGQEAPPVAARLLWEYKIVLPRDPIDLAVNHEQFNLLGADGWELCATHGETHLKYCIFKRPKR